MKTDKLGVTRLINILDFIFSMSTIEMIIPITKIVWSAIHALNV